ncbi:hypothetical protein EJ08DRAFT_736303 [Tothia fuscella]|uniref:Uncharacterized protein n=1 Tax=Tothia fuscella TaxID=1048955 RepID=A0A9P4NLM4_9PEZI|nr:hypothetical protein EJ08DRAFT_736303 [Tothia fuscella]
MRPFILTSLLSSLTLIAAPNTTTTTLLPSPIPTTTLPVLLPPTETPDAEQDPLLADPSNFELLKRKGGGKGGGRSGGHHRGGNHSHSAGTSNKVNLIGVGASGGGKGGGGGKTGSSSSSSSGTTIVAGGSGKNGTRNAAQSTFDAAGFGGRGVMVAVIGVYLCSWFGAGL